MFMFTFKLAFILYPCVDVDVDGPVHHFVYFFKSFIK